MKPQQPRNLKSIELSRRDTLKLLGAGSLGVVLASCGFGTAGSSPPTTAPPSSGGSTGPTTAPPSSGGSTGPTSIRYWTFFGSGEANNPRATSQGMILDAFRKANPSIQVIEEVIPWNQLHTQLIQASAANRAPDVTRQLDQYVSLLAQSGAIYPLDEFVSGWTDTQKTDFLYPWDDTVIDGKKYGFRQSVRVANLNFYRPDFFKAAGFDGPPLTVDAFTEAVKALTKGPLVGFAMPFSKADSINRYMQTVPSLYWSLGSDLVDPTTGKATFHGDAGVQINQWFQDLVYVHKVMPVGVSTMDSEAVNQMFAGGTLASNWHHSSQWTEWISLVQKSQLATTTMPNWSGGLTPASTEGGWTLQMSTGGNRDAAWKLIDFFNSKEAELMDAQVAGELPTRASTLQDPFFQTAAFERQRGWLEYLQKNGHPATTIKIAHRAELADILGAAFQTIIASKADVKSTLADAASQYDQIV